MCYRVTRVPPTFEKCDVCMRVVYSANTPGTEEDIDELVGVMICDLFNIQCLCDLLDMYCLRTAKVKQVLA